MSVNTLTGYLDNVLIDKLVIITKSLEQEYAYANIPKDLFKEISKNVLLDNLSKLVNKNSTINTKKFKMLMQKYLDDYLILKLSSQEEDDYDSVAMFLRYISQNTCFNDDYSHNLQELSKITTFLNKFKNIITIDTYTQILTQCDVLNHILKEIINKNNHLITSHQLEDLDIDDGLLTFIEAYFLINNIKLDDQEEENDSLTSSLEIYLQEIRKYPCLSHEEEVILAKKVKEGDPIAQEQFFKSNLALSVFIAKRYLGRGLEFADLIQEGNIGLMNAVKRFDVDRGYHFSTYAFYWIRQSIRKAICDTAKAIRIPEGRYTEIGKFRRQCHELEESLGYPPSFEQIAKYTEKSISLVKELCHIHRDIISLNALVGEDHDTELQDLIPNEETTEEIAIKKVLPLDVLRLLNKSGLSEREIMIIKGYFGLDSPRKTLEDLSIEFHVSRERIRQIKDVSLEKLRQIPAFYELITFNPPSKNKKTKDIIRYDEEQILSERKFYTDFDIDTDNIIKKTYTKVKLTTVEQNLITLFYGLDGKTPLSYDELGYASHLNEKWAKYMLDKTIRKIQKELTAHEFDEFSQILDKSSKTYQVYRSSLNTDNTIWKKRLK